jgi:PPOX class probable F420-dependent enzyme
MSDHERVRLGAGVVPGPLSQQEQVEFLARPLIARLATVRPDGVPYVNPLWFHWDGEYFWIVARRKSAYVDYLRANPRVCLSIASDELPYTRVTVIGLAEVVNQDGSSDEWWPYAEHMGRRYVGEIDAGYAERTRSQGRWLVRITPEETITWRGGGWSRRYVEGDS